MPLRPAHLGKVRPEGAVPLTGPFCDATGSLGDHSGALGRLIVGLLAGCWLVSALIYRAVGRDDLDSEAQGS